MIHKVSDVLRTDDVNFRKLSTGPRCLSGQAFHIDCYGVARLAGDDDVHGLLVSERKIGIGAEPMKNCEHVELSSQVGVVSGHVRNASNEN